MLKKDLQQLEKKLKEEKKELEKEVKRQVALPDFGSDVDPDQETDESGAYSNQLSVVQTLKNRLADINTALKKIKNGKYGICEKCKQEISLNLLKINPESHLCQKCKSNR